ncbi:MAG: bifunctional oligoribonuclease/PAP phosphatase NrnA [Acidimicrobiia bacterium]|nr:bifunctional oligoribonuclease/PAP phosphatase NrnA [Acidimicrobiia bacterium]
MSEAFERAVEVIGDADELVLACHIGPDGDALGSMLGFGMAASRAGKRVVASFGTPFVVPDTYRFLELDLLVPPAQVPEEPAVFVCFDAGSADRLGELAAVASRAGTVVVIDHHVTNEGFGDVNLIDPEAAATAEIVIRLLERLGWEVDQPMATALLAGLVTDTGRFQYSNTTPETLRAAARMIEAGARPEVIGQHVYEETPFGYLRAAGAVLGRAQLDPDRRLVWSILTKEDLAESGISHGDTDPLIDSVRTAIESDVALLVKEMEGGRVKGSLRSRGRVDVGALAVELGGGGHHNAAGFTMEGTAEEAVEAVRSRLEPVE